MSTKTEEEIIFEKYRTKERFVLEEIIFKNKKLIVPDVVSFAYQVKEIFGDEIYKFKSSSDAPLIYDCGANIGISVLYFKTLFPNSKIKAFEADEKICAILRENTQNLSDVEIFHNAVWINDEELTFSSEGADGGSLINDFDCKQTVKAIRLKEILETEQEIDFLKIDIEGSEFEVILDCKEELKKVNNIFLEYHSIVGIEQSLGEILTVLTHAGFRYHIQNISSQPCPYIKQNLWCNMDLQVNIFGSKHS